MKNGTQFRKSISPRERLAIALRFFLATGNSYSSLQYLFRESTFILLFSRRNDPIRFLIFFLDFE
ncbi:unnamed protein product [Acanthoscelides obtectus]|uniref:Uncharacterized protein n=1 Tax=Acanthoscelides obtectus TaxID=200917 RepID=A0A9P0L399_ACAOB|nr:unnamed protein product [Acanthoscelides obtectus]CAK1669119.1 hypothetical protein AOBTE_LOCUS26813 [Acanthoscelides obtectus]